MKYKDSKGFHEAGDVITIDDNYSTWKFSRLSFGKQYEVVKSNSYYIYQLKESNGDHLFVKMDHQYFRFIGTISAPVQFDASVSGRKNGKNKMELVETGFPNALLMLGEVMTWAGDNKNYAPNDWKGIPDAANAFLGAASRHRLKRLIGATDDEESGLPHLAHEAFNVLAQLELLLTGKLK